MMHIKHLWLVAVSLSLIVASIPYYSMSAFADTDIYSVTVPRDDVDNLDRANLSSHNRFIGEEITDSSSLINQSFNKITIPLEKGNDANPPLTGNVLIGIWSNSTTPTASNSLHLFGTMPAVNIADSLTSYSFTGSSYTLSAGEVIGIFYGVETVGQAIFVSTKMDTFNGSSTHLVCFSNGHATGTCGDQSAGANQWIDATNWDMLATFTLSDVTSTSFCLDLNGDGATDICYTDTNGDGIPDSGGALATIANQNPPVLAIGKLLCQTGFNTDCTNGEPTDTDPTTNGSGLVLFFIVLVTMLALVGVALYGRISVEYHMMLLVVVIMIAVGIAVAFNWIDQLWFYLMIFIIIGFATMSTTAFVLRKKNGSGASE